MDDQNQPGFDVLRPNGKSRFVIFCDHASNRIPPELDGLGLRPSDLARHIALDIGAVGLAEELSNIFDAPAILCATSRLVIDCNRHPGAIDFIPEQSEALAALTRRNVEEAARSVTTPRPVPTVAQFAKPARIQGENVRKT